MRYLRDSRVELASQIDLYQYNSGVRLVVGMILIFMFFIPAITWAYTPGAHLLQTYELQTFSKLVPSDDPRFVVIPYSLDDRERGQQWIEFMNLANDKKIQPILRLTTRFSTEQNAWIVPNREEIVSLIDSIDQLPWPSGPRHVIVFNEINHAAEWGGRIDPQEFATLAKFAARWLQTEPNEYIVLTPALDLAASHSLGAQNPTADAFWYWEAVLTHEPDFLNSFDAWNSHSYPNPGFSSSPDRTERNSLRGFEHELAFLKQYDERDWPVFITETGWDASKVVQSQLKNWHQQAQEIWSHPQVVAVTPFLWQGSPGPFAGFSLYDQDNNRLTSQGESWLAAINSNKSE